VAAAVRHRRDARHGRGLYRTSRRGLLEPTGRGALVRGGVASGGAALESAGARSPTARPGGLAPEVLLGAEARGQLPRGYGRGLPGRAGEGAVDALA